MANDKLVKEVGGWHYQGGMQPWDFISHYHLDFFSGNVVKYVVRCMRKNGIEDLKKALSYLEEMDTYFIQTPRIFRPFKNNLRAMLNQKGFTEQQANKAFIVLKIFLEDDESLLCEKICKTKYALNDLSLACFNEKLF